MAMNNKAPTSVMNMVKDIGGQLKGVFKNLSWQERQKRSMVEHKMMVVDKLQKEERKVSEDVARTEEQLQNRKAVLKKCGCQKSGCRTASCSCKKSTSFCSNLCTCSNCENRDIGESDEDDADESETEARDTEDDEEDDEVDYAGILNQDGPSSLVEDSALMDGGIDGDVA